MQRHLYSLILLLLLSVAGPASWAHTESRSFLWLTNQGGLTGEIHVPLRDVDHVLALDSNGDGALTWGELRAREAEVWALIQRSLKLSAPAGTSIALSSRDFLAAEHSGKGYAVFRVSAPPSAGGTIQIKSDLFHETNPDHQMLVSVTGADGAAQVASISATRSHVEFGAGVESHGFSPVELAMEGAAHILKGWDHVVFLLLLLLPSVVRYVNGKWEPVQSFRETATYLLKIVTAFTIGHSISLALAALNLARPSPQVFEPIIALSLVAAAIPNLVPRLSSRSWLVAVVFGFVHGFGFAEPLSELGLRGAQLAAGLLAFNIGIELSQLLIVAVTLPVVFALRSSRGYVPIVVRGGSISMATLALVTAILRMRS